MPNPTWADAKRTNNAVRRAKQHASLKIVAQAIPLTELAILGHGDASLKNVGSKGTQGGWLLGCCERKVLSGTEG